LLALRDAAEKTWHVTEETPSTAEQEPGRAKGDSETDGPQIHAAALSLTAGTILFSAVLSVVLIVDTEHPVVGSAQGSSSGFGKYVCTYTRHDDLLFSGNSTTSSRLVMLNSTGPDTAEVQCLLLRHRLSPRDVDGYFGPRTEDQVKRLQRQDHVPADGIVGEETWALLRHVE
jgi:peptidoglycan hydrolase-like protein with peptidoglycan-binding domain